MAENKTGFFSCLAACVLLAACSQGDAGVAGHAKPGEQTDAPDSEHTLTYYLDRRGAVSGFHAPHRNQYEALLNGCKEAGEKIVPLSAAEAAKLGMGRIQTWQERGKVATQTDGWELAGGVGTIHDPVCRFKLKKISKLTIRLASGKIYTINLTTGQGTVERVPSPHFGKSPISDAEEAAQERSIIRQGTIKGPIRHVAGHPCQVWTHPKEQTAEPWTECDWSDGKRWGYPAYPGGILLASKMLDGEKTLTTTSFVVGRLPDGGKIFQIPKDVAIRDKGAPASGGNGS